MHNNIMAAGSRDRPPMLATGRYAQWRSRFLRYIDTRPNGDALRKCILKGPYTPTIVTTPAVPATEDSPAVPEQTTVETVMNMTPENRAHFESEKEAIHLILTGIGDEIYSTVDACQTAQEMWEAIERLQQGESLNIQDVKTNLFWEFGQFTSHDGETIESYYTRFYKMMNEMIRNNLTVATMQVNVQFLQQLQPEWSRFVTIVKQQHKLDEVSYHKLFDILKQYQKEVNELRAERMAKNANLLALVATTQTLQDTYYQSSKPHKSYTPTSKASLPTRSHVTTRYKGKEIAKPITPLSESASKEDSDPEQAQRDKDMQKNLALIAKYFKKNYKPTNNNLKISSNTRNKNVDTTPRYKNDNQTGQFRNQREVNVVGARETEKMLLCKQAEKGVQLQAEQSDWLADTDEEIDEQELEAHYSYMAKIQEVPNADSGTNTEPLEQVQYNTDDNVFANDIQHFEQSESITNTCAVETGDSNVIPDSPDMCDNDIQDDQNDVECDDERVALANLIANLKLDVDENKKIQKQLKKANATLTQELTECKSILAETSRTLGESNSIRDSCLVALQNKQTEFERYKAFNDRTVDYDKLERKLNETLGLLAQKEIDIKEGLKVKAYEISVVKEKHDELVKQSLLTKSHYEGLVKEKTKVITDLKLKEEKDIDKMISMENQLKFLNEIVYKRSQSIQTIHMLAPKCPTFNGRPTFANLIYLKKAQYEKPCLYAIPHDQSDPANRLIPDREEILTLEEESRSKLNKDLVKPFDYTKLNSLYEIFKPLTQHYEIQFAQENEIRKKMWRKSFVKTKPNIFKNIDFLPVSKSISKSRQAYNVMTNNINHLKEIVDQAWVKHSNDRLHLRNPTAQDMEILIKTCLIPLALKTQNDSFAFVHELKQEMHADLKYVESLEDEIDELESDKAEFSNMYDMLLQECVSNDIMCLYLQSSSDLDEITELQCLYLHKVRECDCLAQKLSEQTEFVSKEIYTELLRSFAKLEKHSISLEIALQQCQEQLKNDTVCKEKASNVFRKEHEQYFKIQDLKAQLQDKNIAVRELEKLVEKCKGKSVDTKFDKPFVVRQPNAQRILKPSVLGKLAPFSDSLERTNFAKKKSVSKTNESEGLSKPVTRCESIVKLKWGDSNVIPDSPDMCDKIFKIDKNDVNVIDWSRVTEFERYKAFNDRIVDYDKLERKLNETLGLLAQKEIDIKEGLKVKAYEISVVKEKHDELVKQSLLTKSHYEGLVKEKTKVITDLKLKEEKDIDKMISMENQLKFLNEIVYKRSQSIQTIHMLAPKCPTFNGRPTFANPMYLKNAQYEKPYLYAIPHDQSDPANNTSPIGRDSLTLDNEVDHNLNKDYYESLEDEIDEVESDKAKFSNMYDMILQECVSNDIMCSYLQSSSDLDEITELQCLYLHKVKEYDCLAQKLSEYQQNLTTENDTVCKEKASNVFQKEREQYFEIQDLKAQLQDKNIAINLNETKRAETSVANDTSGLVPQRQKASDYDNPDPAPELQNVSPSADTTISRITDGQRSLDKLKVHGNPSKPVQTRRQLATDPEMCMFALTEELHQFDRLQVWELVDKLVGKNVIKLKYQARPTEKHLKEVKRIFRYLRGTINMGLWYPKGSGFDLTAFSDVDHAGCVDTRKSTSGGIQFLGDKLVSWMSKKQDCTAMSSAEAEYVALSASCAQVMWMRTQLQDYGFNYNKIPLYCDSQSAIAISCNPVHTSRTKHIQTRSYALSWKPCQGDSLNLPDHRIHKDGDGDTLFQLKSDSLPHAHAQTTKTYYKH
ncbi:hypothetical protein Tco_0012369 [Tanacetum coccineum]